MSMTKSRRSVYNKSWYKRECKFDMKRRKREYNRKIRHQKLSEDSCSRGYNQKFRHLEWNTLLNIGRYNDPEEIIFLLDYFFDHFLYVFIHIITDESF